MLTCELHCVSSAEHVEQIYTGFGRLARRGLLSIQLRRDPVYSAHVYSLPLLHVVLRGPSITEGPLRITFDLSDEATLPDDLYGSDLVFKRSFDPDVVAALPHAERIHPLGLNYATVERSGFALRRALWARGFREFAEAFVRQSSFLSRLLGIQLSVSTCRTSHFEGVPRLDSEPKILFMVRLWDPAKVDDPRLHAERTRLNEMRVECVRTLRAAFPDLFQGGLVPTPYAVENHPDSVLLDSALAHKRNYLKCVHASSICIATSGLRGSIGWKFAEYVAAAKAIVSEPVRIRTPGPLCEGVNYLTFTDPSECVARVRQLVDEPERRLAMMRANAAYYAGWLRPDMLVCNAIATALASRDPGASQAFPPPSMRAPAPAPG